MREEKGKNILIVVLLVIVVALVAFVVLVLTNTISINLGTKTNSNNGDNNSVEISDNDNYVDNGNETESDSSMNNTIEYSQDTFKKIVDNELYILFGFKSLNEVTNQRKLTLAFNLIEKEYSHNDNDVYSSVQSVSTERVEEAFNKTSISKLGIQHQDFDVYKLNNDYYNRNNQWMSKRNLFYCGIQTQASKVSDYQVKDNKYILSVKYMFPDDCEGMEKYYGTYLNADRNESNFIVKAYTGSYEANNVEYINPKDYLNENYASIKDKLDTYVYTFEVNNGKIELVDFSIN